jgi:SAM-dependent methyltransferase
LTRILRITRNISDRIRTLSRYVDLDDTCDMGGSKGYFVEALLAAGYKRAYGIDPNKAQIEAAQKRGVPMYEGSTENAVELFKEHGTKNASLFHVIEHLHDPLLVVRQIYQALPAGGHLIVETPDFDSYTFKSTDYKHKLIYPEHTFYFNFRNLQALLEQTGFRIVYAGKRDFDQYYLSAHESLSRLGLMRKGESPNFPKKILVKICSLFLRTPLSLLVKWFDRQSFSLILAQKK